MSGSRRNITRFVPLAAIGLCVALAGCSAPTSQPVGGSSSSKADKARKDAEALAVNSVIAGAEAQAAAVPESRQSLKINVRITPDGIETAKVSKPPVPGTPIPAPVAPVAPASETAKGSPAPKNPQRPGTIIREHVVSTVPYSTEAEAEEDALALARDLVERKLAALDPPVRYKPSTGEIAEFVRKDSRNVRPPTAEEKETFDRYGLPNNLVYVEYDVEVTADQVRELRAQERVSAGMRILGMLVAVSLAGFLFLRADEWTKGYLTRWLAFAAVLLGGGVAAVLIFV
jgi:hypothetical protein